MMMTDEQQAPQASWSAGLCRRIIPCLDVDANGRVVKGIKFQGLRDIGDPVELACFYQEQGADELVFLDISASHQDRDTLYHWVSEVAARLMIPFTVGGGVRTLDDVKRLLAAGADKVSVNSAALTRPELIQEIAHEAGSQCCVLAIDAKKTGTTPSGWEALTHGGRRGSGKDALAWAEEGVTLGAGEILLTSWDQDGTLEGFDLPLTRAVSQRVSAPVIASGGAAGPESFVAAFQAGFADAALAASIFHDRTYSIAQVKQACAMAGLAVRL